MDPLQAGWRMTLSTPGPGMPSPSLPGVQPVDDTFEKSAPRWMPPSPVLSLARPGSISSLRECYKPLAEWSGRLVLPQPGQRRGDGGVYIQIENAPGAYSHLKGRTLWLSFDNSPAMGDYGKLVTTDITFSDLTRASIRKGNVHPERLDGWKAVGPLETLAGTRPRDDVKVSLAEVKVVADSETGFALAIGKEPVQIEGSQVALVRVLSSGDEGKQTLTVIHYNPRTKGFDGPSETLLLPPHDAYAITMNTLMGIEGSPLNRDGWYIYGDRNDDGSFVARSLEPRALCSLRPDSLVTDLPSSLSHIRRFNWVDTPARKGAISKVLLAPGGPGTPGQNSPCGLQALRSR